MSRSSGPRQVLEKRWLLQTVPPLITNYTSMKAWLTGHADIH
ncbi:hypothetical protein [Lacticaseibacillus paracasei]